MTLNTLKEITNRNIAEFTLTDPSIITTVDSFVIPQNAQLLHFKNNDKTFDKIFSQKAQSERKTDRRYFHYKRFDVAYKFIDEDYVTASALSNFAGTSDDIKEYEHFFEVTKIQYKKSFIDQQKDNLFIFCLTADNKTERFWKEYVSDHKGLCLEFEFTDKNYLWHLFELRKICYDNGNGFSFYSRMQDEINLSFKKYLHTPGLAKFAALYKRQTEFDWERETRLLFNWGHYHTDLVKNSFTVIPVDSKKYLKIPFDNNLFKLTLKSITIGKKLEATQKDKIKSLALMKGVPTMDE